MSVDWPTVYLRGCATFQEGYVNPTQRKPEYFDGDIKWLRAVDLNDGFVKNTTRTLSKKGFESAGKSAYLFEPGTLAISKSGTIGRIGILKDYMCGNRAVINIKVDESKCNSLFIFFILLANRPNIESLAVGSVQKNLYTSALGSLEFQLPPRETQDDIAKILSNLTNKIEINSQTNQTLEQIAQAIFKSWFVDFEPVKAKIAVLEAGGTAEQAELAAMSAISSKDETALKQLQAEQPEVYAELAQTAALFPSAMIDSELGEIPEGWALIRIESLIELAYGKALKKTDRTEGRFPVYGSGGINGTHSESLVDGPGIIVGRKGTVGSLYWEHRDFYPIDTVFYVKPKENISLEYSYYLLQTLGLEGMNTDAAVPGLNRNNVYRLEVPGIPDAIIKKFTVTASSITDQIASYIDENALLICLRDSLLPKLLSGEQPIPEVNEGPA